MSRLSIPVQLRWADMDAYGHVNNVQMLQLLEEARIEAFWAHPDAADGERPTAVLDAGPGARTTTLVARQEIEYVRPLSYRRAPAVIDLWLGHLGGASIDVCYEVRDAHAQDADPGGTDPDGSDRDGSDPDGSDPDGSDPGVSGGPRTVYARACTTVVLVDTTTGAPRRITDAERAAWSPYLGEMVAMRRRPDRGGPAPAPAAGTAG